MTTATWITLGRLFVVPFFAILALQYGLTIQSGSAVEAWRWAALGVFILAAVSDGIDGWVARRFNQKSRLGSILDPIADKVLVLAAVVVLTAVDWGPDGWRLPLWFALLVIARDVLILGGVAYLHFTDHYVEVAPHWSGKACTFALMFTLGWVMLRWIPFSPLYPCLVTAVFVIWSTVIYLRQGTEILGKRSAFSATKEGRKQTR